MKKLGFGFMRLPQSNENDWASVDFERVTAMVDAYMQKGFHYFDTGYVYHMGQSEAAVKQAVVARYPRESFTVADKMPVWMIQSHADYQKYFDEQRGRLGVDCIDYYLFHALTTDNYRKMLKHDGFSFMQRAKAEGKIKKFGFSYHDGAETLDKILTEHPEADFVQLQINYIDWENETVESRKCYETALKHNKQIIVMEPVKGGSLAKVPPEAQKLFAECRPDMSAASWAIRFAASLENVALVLSGMSNMEQLLDNIGYMDNFSPLSAEESEVIRKVREIVLSNPGIPCTACRYCVEDCPKNIPIPKYFSLYNDSKLFGMSPGLAVYYTTLTQTFGKASECIDCGNCEKHCPQHLGVIEHMKEVVSVFEKAGTT
jgi:predicted aldo/keto reductase-like oxidoreductase